MKCASSFWILIITLTVISENCGRSLVQDTSFSRSPLINSNNPSCHWDHLLRDSLFFLVSRRRTSTTFSPVSSYYDCNLQIKTSVSEKSNHSYDFLVPAEITTASIFKLIRFAVLFPPNQNQSVPPELSSEHNAMKSWSDTRKFGAQLFDSISKKSS